MTYANHDTYVGEWEEDLEDGEGTMKYHNGDVYTGKFSKGKMHGKGVYEYAAGDTLKSIGEWNEGNKCGFFEDVVRVLKQVSYDEYDSKSDSKSKREALFDVALPKSRKRRKVSVSP